jgi:hypothetical protein
MKYLKLFENFGGEDSKWIITSALDPIGVDEVAFPEKYKDTSMFRLFGFTEEPSEEDINHLKSWLEEEGYFYLFFSKSIIVSDKPIRETCIDWLNTNYSNMEEVKDKDHGCILYRYNPGNNIIFYNINNNKVYVSYFLIWSFFDEYFCFEDSMTIGITKDWLSSNYNLNNVNIEGIMNNALRLDQETHQ